MNSWWLKLIFFVLIIAIWQGIVQLSIWPSYIFPSFFSVLSSIWRGLRNGSVPIAIFISLRRIAIGYGLSLIIGIPVGLILGRVKIIQQTVGSVFLGLQALPSVCWLPLALLWFGLSENAIIFVVIMGAVLSITLSTADGVRNTPPLYLDAARTMGATGFVLYTRVVLPAALPPVISGMRLGWSFAWRSLMAGELLYVGLGLGHLLTMGRELNDMSQVIGVMLIIISIGLIIESTIFGPLEGRIRERWGLQTIK
jgi:NitT/TauT family transport system permease protein